MRELKEGKFVFTGELEPEKEGSVEHCIEDARKLKGEVVACNVTDNPQSMMATSSLAASHKIQEETGMECIYQLRCADRSRGALVSDVLGASVLGIKNILALTGDHTTLGDTPSSMPVFDYDSAQLTALIRNMVEESEDLHGNEIEKFSGLHVGAAANPGADPLEPEILKLKRKVKAGAEFLQTQVVYEMDVVDRFLEETRDIDVPILVGIFPLKSYGIAKYFHEQMPGVSVPEVLLEGMKKTEEIEDPEEKKKEVDRVNIDYFGDFLRELKGGPASGCHMMAVGYPRIVPKLKKEI